MKHTLKLATVATLCAMATGAMAADLTLYGVVDTGMTFNYGKTKVDVNGSRVSNTTVKNWAMDSGVTAGSRWGLKGSEDLGNGYKVGFQLESGFASDSGKNSDSNRLFNREARLSVYGPYGELSFGRMGAFGAGTGTYDLLSNVAVYGGGWTTPADGFGAAAFFTRTRHDNMVTYASPNFSGAKVYAQYSFKNDSTAEGNEGRNSSDRYAGLGVTYQQGPLTLVSLFDSMQNRTGTTASTNGGKKNSFMVTLGGNYDFGPAKVYLSGQYGKNEKAVGFGSGKMDFYGSYGALVKGYALHTGVAAPLMDGVAKFGFYYADLENAGDGNGCTVDAKVYNVGTSYEYALSKRTGLYAGLAYTVRDLTTRDVVDTKYKNLELTAGLKHTF